MASLGASDLLPKALTCLDKLGYRILPEKMKNCTSRQVFKFEKSNRDSWVLVQCRSNQVDSRRYLIGIIVQALNKVDNVVLYLDGEEQIIIIASEFLVKILLEHQHIGNARYTGKFNQQWRVDFDVSKKTLSPQGSRGKKYNIEPFMFPVPR